MAARAAEAAGRLSRLLRMLQKLLWATIAGELASGALWFVLQAAAISGRTVAAAAAGDVLGAVLWRTQFGQVMLIRLILVGAFAACLVLVHPTRALRAQTWLLGIA